MFETTLLLTKVIIRNAKVSVYSGTPCSCVKKQNSYNTYLPIQNTLAEHRAIGRLLVLTFQFHIPNNYSKNSEQYIGIGSICPFLILEGITSSRRGRNINKYYVRSLRAHGKETVTFKLSPEQKQGIVLVTYIPKDLEKPR